MASGNSACVSHAAPPVPFPSPDLRQPAPPPIDRPRVKAGMIYLIVAVIVAVILVVALYSPFFARAPPTKVVLVAQGTTFEMVPDGHQYYGPLNLTGPLPWYITGTFMVTNSSPAGFGILNASQFSYWRSAGFPALYLNSGGYSSYPAPYDQSVGISFSFSTCYVAWTNRNSTLNDTILVTVAMVATSAY